MIRTACDPVMQSQDHSCGKSKHADASRSKSCTSMPYLLAMTVSILPCTQPLPASSAPSATCMLICVGQMGMVSCTLFNSKPSAPLPSKFGKAMYLCSN